MKHIKPLPAILLPIALVSAGALALVVGAYLLLGLAGALILGGAIAVTAGLIVDVDD